MTKHIVRPTASHPTASRPCSMPDAIYHLAYSQGRISDITWNLPGTGWANTEYRSYIFEAGIDGNDSNASIRETAESRQRRGKTSQQPSRKEQNHMFETSMQQWEAQGMQDPEKVGWRDDRNDNANFGEEPAAGVVPAERRKSTEVRL